MASEKATRALYSMIRQGLTEAVTYRPSGGASATINALVDRLGPQPIPGSSQPVRAWRFELTVLNDSTLGILSTGINTGADQVDLPERSGGTAVTWALGEILEHDGDWLKIGVN